MQKTSRRKFGKLLTAAIAGIPLIRVIARGQRPAQRVSPGVKFKSEFFSEHNTPPPGLFMGGSLVVEVFSDKNDWDADGAVTNGRRKWSVKPKPYETVPPTRPTNIFIAHVKLVDGAGEMVFPTLDNAEKAPVEITATLEKGGQPFGDCHWIAAGDHFEIDLPTDKRLKKKINDKPANARRQRVRFMHESGGNPDQCEWVGIKVVKGGATYYENNNLRDLPGYDETLRLMIWWENR